MKVLLSLLLALLATDGAQTPAHSVKQGLCEPSESQCHVNGTTRSQF
ncbi:hypothetical protein ACG02S_15525 [Roseateles sp. DC23W]|uniref:Uncharacterized protein n=1 Tax=Pelomonas dachongensis TaxID=3299029 RepID=A0ABW7EQ68_9BURK